MSPTTTDTSAEGASDQHSTPPSSPPSEPPDNAIKKADLQDEGNQKEADAEDDDEDEDEGLGDKGKALNHLLNTSSVSSFYYQHWLG